MKKLLSQEKGITIITVTTMIIVMMLIMSVMVYYGRNSVQMESFQGMKADIVELESKALLYYAENKAIPLKSTSQYVDGFQFGSTEFKNPNDSERYYLVDESKLGVTKAYNTDYYINEKTLTVYAANPIKMNGKQYGRFKEDFVSFNDTNNLELPSWALNASSEMFSFDSNNYITGIKSSYAGTHQLNSLIIPAYTPDGKTINGIASGAFADYTVNNGPIKIPSTVKIVSSNILGSGSNPTELYCDANVIDLHAFSNIENIPKITLGPNCQIPDGNEASGGAFSNCRNLKTIVIEGSSIGKYTFSKNCTNVTDIYFLGNPTTIPEGAFYSCGKNANPLKIHTNINSTQNECVFPDSIITFENYCFMDSGIATINLPSNTREVGRNAFANMNGKLTTVKLNSNLKTIGESAFNYNANLSQVNTGAQTNTIGTSVTSLGINSFKQTRLTTIRVPRGLQTADGSNPFPITPTYY